MQHGNSAKQNEYNTKTVQQEMGTTWSTTKKGATWKKCNTETGATWKEYKMKKVQHGESATRKDCNTKKV